MKTIVTTTCATFLLIAAFAPRAAPTSEDLPVRSTKDVQVIFTSLDRNRDAKISRSEASVKGSVAKRDSPADGTSHADQDVRPATGASLSSSRTQTTLPSSNAAMRPIKNPFTTACDRRATDAAS